MSLFNNNPRLIYLVMLLVPLFWGGAFGTTKHIVSELAPITASAVRFGLAGLLMAVWLTAQGGWDWQLVKKRWAGVLALGATGILLYNICFAIALQSTSAINAALVIVINPVTTALVAVIFMGEAWSWRLGTGLVLSFLGVLTTITKGSLAVLANLTFNHGDMLLLVAVGAWSSYTILGKLLMRDMPPLLATTVSTLAGALMLVLASLHENSWHKVLNLSGQTTLELAYLVVFATVLAFVLYNIGIRRIGASRASAYINLMPVNAMWIAAVFYGEAVTLAHLAGVVLTVSGVLLITYFDGARREKKAAQTA